MIIGAYGTGATNGIIYVRNEYPLAIKHLLIALRQANQLGLLGENILGTGFSFDIKMVRELAHLSAVKKPPSSDRSKEDGGTETAASISC